MLRADDIRTLCKAKTPLRLDGISDYRIFGVDTETYSTPSYGLKSIQIYGDRFSRYITAKDFSKSDVVIRNEICSEFFDWMDSLKGHSILAFFNMKFDFSQIAYYMVNYSGLEYVDTTNKGKGILKKHQIQILESDLNLYKVMFRNSRGYYVVMMDIANFLTATKLDKASREWLNDSKIQLQENADKKFPKKAASPEEIEYAMKDAELTYRLFKQLNLSQVIESTRYVTIAGRTINHFMDYLMEDYRINFNSWAYGTRDKELQKLYADQIEQVMRSSVRGGICQAIHKGFFEDCHHIDARSMYPTQMAKAKIPHGPLLTEPPDDCDYTRIVFPSGYLELKEDHIGYLQFPTKALCERLQWQDEIKPSEYFQSCILDGSIGYWDDEVDIIHRQYKTYGWTEESVYYIAMVDNTVLKPYVDHLYYKKQTTTGTERYYYKILLNSLYGKFLSRPDGIGISYSEGERHKVQQDGRKTYYLPLGSWTAMSGRLDLMNCMNSIPYDNVLYCDTDSCIFTGDRFPDVQLGSELGQWAIENDHFQANIVGPKTYQEITSKGVLTKCAGLSMDVAKTIPFGELKEGNIYKVNKARRDPETWAINIIETEFEVSTKPVAFRRRL